MLILFVLLVAYLLGSLPTALVVSRAVANVDIRTIGDGNMGARNVARTLGWGPGIVVAVADFGKGAAAVVFARYLGLALEWQIAAGACAALGHDFPVFAGFRGGQGMAAILGALFVLMPTETSSGLLMFGSAYALTRSFDISAALGLGLVAWLAWKLSQPTILVICAAALFVSIALKKHYDAPRRKAVSQAKSVDAKQANHGVR